MKAGPLGQGPRAGQILRWRAYCAPPVPHALRREVLFPIRKTVSFHPKGTISYPKGTFSTYFYFSGTKMQLTQEGRASVNPLEGLLCPHCPPPKP